MVNKRQRLEKQRIYQREYYQKNRDKILEKAHQQYDRKTPPKTTKKGDEIQFYREWNKSLQERLKSDDLDSWLLTALQLTVEANNRQIEKINEGIQQDGGKDST